MYETFRPRYHTYIGTVHYIVVPMAPYIYIDRRHLDRVDVVSLRMEGVFWFGLCSADHGKSLCLGFFDFKNSLLASKVKLFKLLVIFLKKKKRCSWQRGFQKKPPPPPLRLVISSSKRFLACCNYALLSSRNSDGGAVYARNLLPCVIRARRLG